jgi:predicted SprT family Zn-dependent metalloprotease
MNCIGDVQKLALNLMGKEFTIKDIRGNEHTLSASELGYYFQFSSAKRRNGNINFTRKRISLSKPTVENNLHQINGPIRNTILHEIAHAFSYHIYGRSGMGHNHKWRSIAIQIGCTGERSTSSYESPKGKYTLVCDSCGKEHPMYRKPKLNRSCGDCDSVYNPKYKLKVIQNY